MKNCNKERKIIKEFLFVKSREEIVYAYIKNF